MITVELWYTADCPYCRKADQILSRVCRRLGIPYVRRHITDYVNPYDYYENLQVLDTETRTVRGSIDLSEVMPRLMPKPLVVIRVYGSDMSTTKCIVFHGFPPTEESERNIETLLRFLLRAVLSGVRVV